MGDLDADAGDEGTEGGEGEGEGEGGAKPTGKRFECKKWNAVVTWKWDIPIENCGICKTNLMTLCIDAQANQGQSSGCDTPCVIAWGLCNHAFHLCCINKWLNNHDNCPMCGQNWETIRAVPQQESSS